MKNDNQTVWYCKKHNTYGDKGWSCAYCGYPTGFKNLEIKDGILNILKVASPLLGIYKRIKL